MKVAASVTMEGGVWDEVLMAPTPYQTHFSPRNDAGTLDFPCFMSPDPIHAKRSAHFLTIASGCLFNFSINSPKGCATSPPCNANGPWANRGAISEGDHVFRIPHNSSRQYLFPKTNRLPKTPLSPGLSNNGRKSLLSINFLMAKNARSSLCLNFSVAIFVRKHLWLEVMRRFNASSTNWVRSSMVKGKVPCCFASSAVGFHPQKHQSRHGHFGLQCAPIIWKRGHRKRGNGVRETRKRGQGATA